MNLFIASFVALFVEIMLIRWLPSYERALAYFTNSVLIASFLGLGLGSMLSRWRRDLINMQPFFLLVVVLIAIFFNRNVKTIGSPEDVFYSNFQRESAITLAVQHTLIFFYVLVAATLLPIGQKIGKELATIASPLRGYTVNIIGSLAGVVAFSMVSFFELSPVWWFAIPCVCLLWFARNQVAFWPILLGEIILLCIVWNAGHGFIWSPYHKLTVSPLTIERRVGILWPEKQLGSELLKRLPDSLGFQVAVDDDFLQMAINLSTTSVAAYPLLHSYREKYDFPYSINSFPYNDVLIVGSGAGNDVAAAIRRGVGRVDAVEIDPAIVRLGKERHPETPYDHPRVRIFTDDARSYFTKTQSRYDLVIFGLLDSHRLYSSMSSVRLDSFVFTIESFREVRRLLKDHGLVMVQHGLGAQFLAERMYRMLAEAFQMPPLVVGHTQIPGLTFVVGPGLSKFFSMPKPVETGFTELATDDWPFFYLRGRKLPREYLITLVSLVAISTFAVLLCANGGIRAVNPHFFFLGAAFLLIETLSVTRIALLFGSTWVTNAIVFSALLVLVLVANVLLAHIGNVNVNVIYVLLTATLFVNFLFPIHVLLQVETPLRLVASGALIAGPIFFAALVFASSFAKTKAADIAFAANLLGAVLGGIAEYSTLILGFNAQFLIAVVIYGLSYLTLRRSV